MDTAVHTHQLHNSETAIAYRTFNSTFKVILEKFPVLHRSQYKAQSNFTHKLHESQFESAVRLL